MQVNEEYAAQLVTANLDHWDNQTCINLAVASYHMEFVSHRCCQELLSKKWTGAIQIVGHQSLKVSSCCYCMSSESAFCSSEKEFLGVP